MLAYGGTIHSPTWDEPGHLVAGISHWQFGNFRVYHVNPPLARAVAAVPMLLVDPKTDWSGYSDEPSSRPEFKLGAEFVRANDSRAFRVFTLARWACIPFSIAGALVSWYWGRTLYGSLSGIVALTLWVFCPNILAFGQLITPDVAATSLGLLASFLFWRWLRDPGWQKVPLLGIAFGLAQLTKFTWIILFGLWPLIWIVWNLRQRRSIWSEALQFVVSFLIGIYVINFGYAFSGTLTKLGDYEFVSCSLGGSIEPRSSGNRFRGTMLEHIPIPLPRDYVAGIDSQKSDFDRGMPSYLRGTWRDDRGWWYYYLYGLGIKVPLGTWLIVLLAGVLTLREVGGQTRWEEGVGFQVSGVGLKGDKGAQVDPSRGGQTPFSRQGLLAGRGVGARKRCQTPAFGWRDEMVLLAPAFAILILVSSQTGFSHHIRYVLPCLPFVYIWASKVARCVEVRSPDTTACGEGDRHILLRGLHTTIAAMVPGQSPAVGAWPVAVIAAIGLGWSVSSSLWVYPHSLSYFNELVGGPKGGHWHLGNSNIDWGQDLLLLKRWYDKHPEARPLHLEYDLPLVEPKLAGIEWEPVPEGPVMNRPGSPTTKNWPWGETQIDSLSQNRPGKGDSPAQ